MGILMLHLQSSSGGKVLYGLLPALPTFLGGMIFNWQSGVTLYNVFISLLLIICGIGSGLLLWNRHVNELAQTNAHWAQDESAKIEAVATYTTELERLLLTITPILSQHVMISREHTEQEIISLTSRFSSMVNELQQIVDSTHNALGGQQQYHLNSVFNTSRDLLQPVLDLLSRLRQAEQNVVDESILTLSEANIKQVLSLLSLALTHYRDDVEALRNNAEQVRGEIDNVLLALQFQDRVSQILTQVENNLLNLKQTIEQIQQQGSNRDGNMLQVDEAVEHIEENYKSVSSPANRVPDSSDDLTFF
jgi:archaellum component FlaC